VNISYWSVFIFIEENQCVFINIKFNTQEETCIFTQLVTLFYFIIIIYTLGQIFVNSITFYRRKLD